MVWGRDYHIPVKFLHILKFLRIPAKFHAVSPHSSQPCKVSLSYCIYSFESRQFLEARAVVVSLETLLLSRSITFGKSKMTCVLHCGANLRRTNKCVLQLLKKYTQVIKL